MSPFGPRILLLSPHPDDEVVGAAAAIGRARAAGSVVFVAHLTTGVPSPDTLWPWERGRHGERVATRWEEAKAAAAMLGIEIVSLSPRPTRSLRHALVEAGSEVRDLIDRLAITTLWVPAYEGGHADHDAANALASTFIGRVSVFEFPEYNFLGGRVRSQRFVSPRATDIEIALSDAESRTKKRLLALYASERGNLGYVGVDREAIRPLIPYDYAQPPHTGRPFYRRFAWVPFTHPRIDSTRPDEVSADIAAYLRAVDTSG